MQGRRWTKRCCIPTLVDRDELHHVGLVFLGLDQTDGASPPPMAVWLECPSVVVLRGNVWLGGQLDLGVWRGREQQIALLRRSLLEFCEKGPQGSQLPFESIDPGQCRSGLLER